MGDRLFRNGLNQDRTIDSYNKAIVIKKRLDRIALGNFGDTKSVGDGVFEFRIDYGLGYRVYFAQVGTIVLLLLCGGDKRTQNQDIVIAKNYLNQFNQRENANN